jgi:homoserine trans-succinylase
MYRGADKSLARPTSQYTLFHGENISFDASLLTYINSSNIPPIMIINRIHETQILLSLKLVSFLVGLRNYQHPGTDRGDDNSLTRPTSRCILFDGENIQFDASLVIYINSTNIRPIMIINRIYEHQNLLSL